MDLDVVDGIPCTNVARTLCDLGAVVLADKVEQALDDALRRGCSERWIRETLVAARPTGSEAEPRIFGGCFDLPDRSGADARQLVRTVRRAPARQLGAASTGPPAPSSRDGRHTSRVSGPRLARGRIRCGAVGSQSVTEAPDERAAITYAMRGSRSQDWEVMYAVWADLGEGERFRRGVETVYLRRAAARYRV